MGQPVLIIKKNRNRNKNIFQLRAGNKKVRNLAYQSARAFELNQTHTHTRMRYVRVCVYVLMLAGKFFILAKAAKENKL